MEGGSFFLFLYPLAKGLMKLVNLKGNHVGGFRVLSWESIIIRQQSDCSFLPPLPETCQPQSAEN